MVLDAPGASMPRLQRTTPALEVPRSLAETKIAPAGTVSSTGAFVAVAPPTLTTVIAYDTKSCVGTVASAVLPIVSDGGASTDASKETPNVSGTPSALIEYWSFVRVAPAGDVTCRVTLTLEVEWAATLGNCHVTAEPFKAPPFVADTNVVPAGSVSLIVAFEGAVAPRFRYWR